MKGSNVEDIINISDKFRKISKDKCADFYKYIDGLVPKEERGDYKIEIRPITDKEWEVHQPKTPKGGSRHISLEPYLTKSKLQKKIL
jgi:hypothetical protein